MGRFKCYKKWREREREREIHTQGVKDEKKDMRKKACEGIKRIRKSSKEVNRNEEGSELICGG